MGSYERNGIIMNSEAPFENAMGPLDVGYYILGGIGLVIGIIRANLGGAAFLALLGLILWWGIKANIALAKWRNLCDRQFYADRQLAPEELLGRMVAALTPYGLRVDSSKGMPSVAYRNVRVQVAYNENGTFSLPWSQNLGFFFLDRRYITSYLNTVAVMSIVAYQVQRISSSDFESSEPPSQNNSAEQPDQFIRPQFTNKRILQAAIIGVLVLVTIIGLVLNSSDNKYINTVKNGSPRAYPEVTYGEAFGSFFEAPKWKYIKSDSGDNVVEFKGRCTYQGKEVEAVFQFTILKDSSTFNTTYLSFNDISQNQLVMAGTVAKAFEEYGDSKAASKNTGKKQKGAAVTEHEVSSEMPETALESQESSLTDSSEIQAEETVQEGGGEFKISDEEEKEPVKSSAREIPIKTIFSDETNECSWKSDSTGYYIIPFYDSYTETYNVWFTLDNNTVWANTAYTVTISEMERTANGGLTCRGKMMFATKSGDEENGTVEITWDSLETVDFPTIRMIDGTELTEVDMIAPDYGYYGPCD